MSPQTQPVTWPQARVDELFERFFGDGNSAWTDRDPQSEMTQFVMAQGRYLHEGSDVPVVLPRRMPDIPQRRIYYVLARSASHATEVAELVTAFVGPSFANPFTGIPDELNVEDPPERTLAELANPGAVFRLVFTGNDNAKAAWNMLRAMQRLVASRPARSWHLPRPVGRMLAEFNVAVAAGEHTASADILRQLTSGGLSGANLAHLRIKRLAQLGLDDELLSLPYLADVIAADPPQPVKGAVLEAAYNVIIAEPLAANDVEAALATLEERGSVLPALLNGDRRSFSPEARAALLLTALLCSNDEVISSIVSDPDYLTSLHSLAPALVPYLQTEKPHLFLLGNTAPDAFVSAPPALTSWPELITALSADPDQAKSAMAEELWRGWDPPASNDNAIAEILANHGDDEAERTWSVVGAFLEADGYRVSAARSATEFITNALTYGRYSPGDLAGLVALTEIVLRRGPSARDYEKLLDDLRAEASRWVSPERTTPALDLADLLVRAACPAHEARLRLANALLMPLCHHHRWLEPEQLTFAQQLSSELGTELTWPSATEDPQETATDIATSASVLLYSLDEGVLARTEAALGQLWPNLVVHLSHDEVGSVRLRQHARTADLVVLATRCAKHAATGFIRSAARPEALVVEADGSGSASLIRAAANGLRAIVQRG